ncbi:thiosulfate sulfurtransferase-like [Diadema setosum]|uniref:thiosulfate sulfurtransferase-like n=1 Tax=Diadema setosum TaxID=31175 RepID=UPI003B3A0B7A
MASGNTVPALVSVKWLADALKSGTTPEGRPLRVLDATWLGMLNEGREAYSKQHIPGSVYADGNVCRDKTSGYYFTIPSAENFAEFAGKMWGVDGNTHVVVYENDPFYKIMTAPRVWWLFRLYGHDAVSVLDGGLQQWLADGQPVTDKATPDPKPMTFPLAAKRGHLYKSYEDVLQNQSQPKFQLMDSRPVEWYDGTNPSPYPGIKLGIIKTATNIPFPNVLREGSSRFKSQNDLRTLFESHHIDLSKPLTSTCFVGITACILALSAFVVGKEDVAVFDGSWDEYSQKAPENTMTLYELKQA